jgi:hypothetical protein
MRWAAAEVHMRCACARWVLLSHEVGLAAAAAAGCRQWSWLEGLNLSHRT